MSYRIVLLFCLLMIHSSKNWSSAYIFVEDTGSIGSLKGLLKENWNNDDIEILGYTPSSLNVVLNKTNQLQTSMVWILRESFESEALIISRCGHLEHNQYIDNLIKNFTNKKSKIPRLNIGWIPYKRLGQISSQCVLLEVSQNFDLASLATELAELFKPETEFLDENIPEKSLISDSRITTSQKKQIQQSKKIPMKWGQFKKVKSEGIQESLSDAIQKLAYDPDEDLFLTPFVNTDNKLQSNKDSLKQIDKNYLSSKLETYERTSANNESIDTLDFKIEITKNEKNSEIPLQSKPPSLSRSLVTTNTQSKITGISNLIISGQSSIALPSVTSSKSKTETTNYTIPVLKSNLSSLRALYALTNTIIQEKPVISEPNKTVEKNYPVPSNQKAQPSKPLKNQTDKKNLMKELRSDFRKELLDKFRKERGRQTPEWLFEE